MALLLDSDVLIELERGAEAAALDRWLGDDDRTISVITVSELLHGVLRARRPIRMRRRAFVEHLLAGLEAIPSPSPLRAFMPRSGPTWPNAGR